MRVRGQDPGTGPSVDPLVLVLLSRRGGGTEQRLVSHPVDDLNPPPPAPAVSNLMKILNVLTCSKVSFPWCCELRPLSVGGSGTEHPSPSHRRIRHRCRGRCALAHAQHTPPLTSDRTAGVLPARLRPARGCPVGPAGHEWRSSTRPALRRAAPTPACLRDAGDRRCQTPRGSHAPREAAVPGHACPRGRGRRGGGGGGAARPAGWGRSCLAGEPPGPPPPPPGPAAPSPAAFLKVGVYSGPLSRPGAHLPVGNTGICRRNLEGPSPRPLPPLQRGGKIWKCPSPCRLRFASWWPPRGTCCRGEMGLKSPSCELVQDAPIQERYRKTHLPHHRGKIN